MNKRILSLTLALVMILGTFTAVFAEVTTVEQKAAEFLRDNGVLEGDDKGDLLLDKKLERRDAVVLSARLLGEEEKAANTKFDEKTPSWTDVRTDKFYVPFFAWAETTGRFEGKGEGIFEPRAGLTTQEYATVLLRILGHELNGKDAWKSVMELAKKEGLLENVDAKADDILMRGNMAVMTLNALGATVKGTGNTLADELNIKLPVPAKLEVEDVYADNLKEVKVVLNGAEVALETIENAENYSMDKSMKIDFVSYNSENNIVSVFLKSEMTNNKQYTLKANGLKDVKGNTVKFEEKFTAVDNQVPVVEKVEALGNKAIKVTMSEPVRKAERSNFSLNGKSLLADVTTRGNEIFIRMFRNLEDGENTLRVKDLKDFADFKVVAEDFEFVVVEDKEAPEVVDYTATTRSVTLTFNEDIDEKTINTKSAYWKLGKTNKYAKSFKVLSGNKVRFDFTDSSELPLNDTIVYVNGIKDYSGNTMKDYEVSVSPELDKVRPNVIKAEVGNRKDEVVVEFDKTMDEKSVKNVKNYKITDKNDKEIKVSKVSYTEGSKKATLSLSKSLSENETYGINIFGLLDDNKYGNMLNEYTGELNVKDSKDFDLELTENDTVEKETSTKDVSIDLYFNKKVDAATALNPENYTIRVNSASGKVLPLTEVSSEIVLRDDKMVTIIVELDKEEDINDVHAIAVLGVEDQNGKRIASYGKLIELEKAIDFGLSSKTVNVEKDTEVKFEFNSVLDKVVDEDLIKFPKEIGEVEEITVSNKTVIVKVKDMDVSKIDKTDVIFEAGAVRALNGKVNSKETVTLNNDVKAKLDKIVVDETKIDLSENKSGVVVPVTLTFNKKVKNLGNNIEFTYETTNGDKIKVGSDFVEADSVNHETKLTFEDLSKVAGTKGVFTARLKTDLDEMLAGELGVESKQITIDAKLKNKAEDLKTLEKVNLENIELAENTEINEDNVVKHIESIKVGEKTVKDLGITVAAKENGEKYDITLTLNDAKLVKEKVTVTVAGAGA